MIRRICSLLVISLCLAPIAGAEPTDGEGVGPEPVVISQKGKRFHPATVTVQKGQSLVFRNDDPVTHNVFSRTEGTLFNLKMQAPGQEDVVPFDEPGDVVVRCAIHPTMKLTVHVEE